VFFISHIRRHTVVIMRDVKEILGNGTERELVPLTEAKFRGVRDGGGVDLTAEQLEFATRKWDKQAQGRTLEQDQHTYTDLMARLSVDDTDDPANVAAYDAVDRAMRGMEHADLPRGQVWKDGDMKKLVERKLLERAKTSSDFAVFEEQPLSPPWPAYEQFPGDEEERLDVLKAQQHHLPEVLAYERQRGLRPAMIQLLEEAIADQDAPAAVQQAGSAGYVS
jgi:hypothetical protein